MPEELPPEFTQAAERAFDITKAASLIKRLELLQKTLKENVGEPIIYHWPFLKGVDRLWLPSHQHINAGIVEDPELLLDGQRWVQIAAPQNAYSTKCNEQFSQGHSYSRNLSLQIDNLLHFHINGDVKENMGFIIGRKTTEQFLNAVEPEQSEFIRQSLPA